MRIITDGIEMARKAPNPGICMALPGKITFEIEYSFPAAGLHSANHHQEDKTIKWKCGRLRNEKQALPSTSLHVKNQSSG